MAQPDEDKTAYRLEQRYMMLMISLPYVTFWIITFVMSYWNSDIAAQRALLENEMADAFHIVTAFYFADSVIGRAIRAFKGK